MKINHKMSLKQFLKKKITVTQIRSFSKLTKKQKANLVGLGLSGIDSSSELTCSQSVLGMLKVTQHLIGVRS